VELQRDLLQVEDDVRGILDHARDRRELVLHAVDLHGRDLNNQKQSVIDIKPLLAPRIQCDPAVYLSIGKKICRDQGRSSDIERIDLLLEVRESNQPKFQPVINITDFCKKNPTYSFFTSNGWILKN